MISTLIFSLALQRKQSFTWGLRLSWSSGMWCHVVLYTHAVSEWTLKWFNDFITQCLFAIKVENKTSKYKQISSRGPPQEAVTSTTLINVMINELPAQQVKSRMLSKHSSWHPSNLDITAKISGTPALKNMLWRCHDNIYKQKTFYQIFTWAKNNPCQFENQ
jgi:hypothetical protein